MRREWECVLLYYATYTYSENIKDSAGELDTELKSTDKFLYQNQLGEKLTGLILNEMLTHTHHNSFIHSTDSLLHTHTCERSVNSVSFCVKTQI